MPGITALSPSFTQVSKMQKRTGPGLSGPLPIRAGKAAGISFLPKDLSSYTEKEMDNHHEFFDRIAKEAEAKTQDGHALKGLVSESLTAISRRITLPHPDACLLVLRRKRGVCAVPLFPTTGD